jgi:assimilatory nitrate reductase catalytic subunit
VTAANPAGTPRVFLERFNTPDGKARMIAVDHGGPADDGPPPEPR